MYLHAKPKKALVSCCMCRLDAPLPCLYKYSCVKGLQTQPVTYSPEQGIADGTSPSAQTKSGRGGSAKTASQDDTEGVLGLGVLNLQSHIYDMNMLETHQALSGPAAKAQDLA
eukprot:1145843-Pelagomonas_calceolata.AAC.3